MVSQVCLNASQNTPLVDKLKKEVNQCIAEQKEKFARTNIREEYSNWLKSYKMFVECAWILVCCRTHFEKKQFVSNAIAYFKSMSTPSYFSQQTSTWT